MSSSYHVHVPLQIIQLNSCNLPNPT
ncbi:hypothetical protein F383_26106 [Gossypium arboreum]|uniref:Uncharacterized protein n=1 Tax=Gossypium arboreum TaxID=29729 RepID=A0A0B0P576_GOSAR|nr:hypothetical protein F383_26106 [Gossypium arboreum]